MARNFSNTASGASLAGSISTSATSVTLDGFTGYPSPPFTATIDRGEATEEIVLVTAVVGSTVTMTRGYDSTSAAAHSAGASFEHTAIAKDFRDASAHLDATTAHGTASAVVGVDDTQTLRNKTVEALRALATGSAAAVEADNVGGTTGKLFRGLQAGVERFFVDYLGNLTAAGVTGTTASFSGALSAGAATLASAVVTGAASVAGLLSANGGVTIPAGKTLTAGGDASVAGALTVTGAAALNGGATIPTGKKLTLTDAPVAGTDAVNKTALDALGTTADTASTVARRDASGNLSAKQVKATTAAPVAAEDLTRKDWVEAQLATVPRGIEDWASSTTVFTSDGTASPQRLPGTLNRTVSLETGRAYEVKLKGRTNVSVANALVGLFVLGRRGATPVSTDTTVGTFRAVMPAAGGPGQSDVLSSGVFQVGFTDSYVLSPFLSVSAGTANFLSDARAIEDIVIEDIGPAFVGLPILS
jgi:hypothetical protein